ncbi:type II toxin-antitoxin system Phd/YefM family antitoxin [Acinetobacter puyangensis]|jgi:prevent-host-death family protein|uniref:Antitoxin n=1 Tax=Acinetobacter puyangensis TaxID=1096779 RepID=A0A240E7V2_9GAMM|nr:type II toxin-antitoxin system Phd/YefM family antitoxin [Acinetobacter puyangensis]SNX44702.1 prevent-host-death family protein [Acinetobacter puyangensis]
MTTTIKIKPISYIKSNAAEMMKFVNEQKESIIITQNGEAKAVLVDFESYQNMQNAFGLLNIFQIAETEYANGEASSDDEVFQRLRSRMAK